MLIIIAQLVKFRRYKVLNTTEHFLYHIISSIYIKGVARNVRRYEIPLEIHIFIRNAYSQKHFNYVQIRGMLIR